jgi:hypothetical protein
MGHNEARPTSVAGSLASNTARGVRLRNCRRRRSAGEYALRAAGRRRPECWPPRDRRRWRDADRCGLCSALFLTFVTLVGGMARSIAICGRHLFNARDLGVLRSGTDYLRFSWSRDGRPFPPQPPTPNGLPSSPAPHQAGLLICSQFNVWPGRIATSGQAP